MCGVWEFKCKINYGSFWSPSGIYTKRSIQYILYILYILYTQKELEFQVHTVNRK
jgi:hypothetical protein